LVSLGQITFGYPAGIPLEEMGAKFGDDIAVCSADVNLDSSVEDDTSFRGAKGQQDPDSDASGVVAHSKREEVGTGQASHVEEK
jgi:hypothetical protein